MRVRQFIAACDYPQLSSDKLKARILDDLWQEAWAIVPHMAEILATIPHLNTSTVDSRAKMLVFLESKLLYVHNYLDVLMASPHAVTLLQTIETGFPWRTRHSECCPNLPFPPHRFLFPPAGMLLLSFLSLRIYLRTILYAPVRAAGVQIGNLELESQLGESHAYEICRGYAAVEDEFGDNLSSLLPCFNALVMAGFSCPPELRTWLWHKLAHFEQLGHAYVQPVKKNLSVVWGMPELLTQSFESWKKRPLENRIEDLNANDIDTAAKIVVTVDEPEFSNSGDESEIG